MKAEIRTNRNRGGAAGPVKRGSVLVSMLLLGLALCLFPATGGNAQQPQQAPKAAMPAVSPDKTAPPAVESVLEPKAIEVLKAASSKLAAARTMSFTAVVTYESPSRLGPPLAYTTKSEVTVKRPNGLRVITPADGPASEFYYDGRKMTAFAPAEKLVAVADAPPTIDGMLRSAFDSAAIYYPFADVIVADPYKDIADGLKIAFFIGQSRVVGGTTTDMVAWANDDVFVQAWIGAEDKLPRRLRAVYRKDPSQLRHDMELSNWKLDPVIPADAFTLKGIGSAKPIPFAHPDARPPLGARVPGEGRTIQK
jgi:hypothetical protein